MANHFGSDADIARLEQAREEADRLYNEALTRVDGAQAAVPELPARPPGLDLARLSAVNEAWRVAPAPEEFIGKGWKRRLRAWIWGLVGPIVERQQHFNGVLVDHLNRTAPAAAEGQEALAAALDAVREHAAALATFQSRLIQYLQQITLFVDTRDRRVAGVSHTALRVLDHLAAEIRKRAAAAASREQRYTRQVDELRTIVGRVQHSLIAVRGQLEGLAAGAGPGGAAPADAAQGQAADGVASENAPPAGAPSKAGLDATVEAYAYVGFENLYRGSQDEIRSRLADYLPLFKGASEVLDVGCGRGEFLDLLREREISARGVDINAEMVEECRRRGLEASAGDALAYLDTLEDGSLGGFFAAQVVEHLQPDYLVRLLDTAARKLRPGSRIVLETINPRCWFAFFDGYIRDITHVHPLHPDTLAYLLGASGFQRATVRYLSPYPDDGKLQRLPLPEAFGSGGNDETTALETAVKTFNGNVDTLNDLLFTHMDYAAIGERA